MGYAKGPAELRTLFKSFADRISFSQHNVFNPRIMVQGNEAHGSWYFLGPFTFRKDNRQIWIAARYEDDYVKVTILRQSRRLWEREPLKAVSLYSVSHLRWPA